MTNEESTYRRGLRQQRLRLCRLLGQRGRGALLLLVTRHRFVHVIGGGCVGGVGGKLRCRRESIRRLAVLLAKVLAHVVHVKVAGRRNGQFLFLGGRPLLAGGQLLQVVLEHVAAVVEIVVLVVMVVGRGGRRQLVVRRRRRRRLLLEHAVVGQRRGGRGRRQLLLVLVEAVVWRRRLVGVIGMDRRRVLLVVVR